MSNLVQSIRQRYGFDITVNEVEARRALKHLRDNMQEALRSLSEDLYAKDTHFVLEFIQNADDNSYRPEHRACLVLSLDSPNRRLTIYCNEQGFSAENIEAICSVGKSTKKNKVGYIGEKGIGFKSVFKVADVVYVSSREYTFKFDKKEELGMVIPIWTDRYPVIEGWTTFTLELSPDTTIDSLATHLKDIQPSLLLFLRKLEHIQVIVDGVKGQFDCAQLRGEPGITRLTRQQGTQRSIEDYLLVKETAPTYTQEPKREGISESEIVLAFPISADRTPIIQDRAVHAFLPIRTHSIPFIIQADFLLAANREDILVDSKWNMTLRDAIPSVFSLAVKQHFPKVAGLAFNWLQFVPETSSDSFLRPLRRAIVNALAPQPCLLCADGTLRKPEQVIIADQRHRHSSDRGGGPLIPSRFIAGKHYLHDGYKASRDAAVLMELGVVTMSRKSLLAGLQAMSSAGAFAEQDAYWFERISAALCHHHDILFYDRRSIHERERFLSALDTLPIVPLTTGLYTSASHNHLFFDTNLSGVPTDLGISLVRPPAAGSHRDQLLRILGVQDADPSTVTKRILDLHNAGPLSDRHKSSLPSHARFLFYHSRGVSRPKFYVNTTNGCRISSKQVYMDRGIHASLQRFIDLTGVSVLHADYYSQVQGDSQQEWIEWLRTKLHINIAPVVVESNGNLTPEFAKFVSLTDIHTLLDLLRYHWPILQGSVHDTKNLREIMVTCADGSCCALSSTFVKRSALRMMDDLPFLPLSDPDNEEWDFLKKLGVSLSADSASYLKLLVRMKESPTQPTKEAVEDIYRHLETRFNDGQENTIKAAFKDQNLLWVPPHVAYTGPMDNNRWISTDHAVRRGPRSMRLKLNVLSAYPSFQKFFEDQLMISRCPDDILLSECRALQVARMTPKDRLHRLYGILSDISEALSDLDRAKTMAGWLPSLVNLHVFPVTTPAGELAFRTAASKFYIPDSSGELAELFRDMCTLLQTSRELPLLRLTPLLKLKTFSEHVQDLQDHVTVQVTITGASVLLQAQSRKLSSRLHCIRRLLSVKDIEVNELHTRIRLFEVEAIRYEYTFQGVKREKNRDIHMESNETQDCIDVYMPQGSSEENIPVLVATELARFFTTLSFEDACVALSMPLGALDLFLRNKGVPDVDYENPPDMDESEVQDEPNDVDGEEKSQASASRPTTPGGRSEIIPDIRVAARAIVEHNMANILHMSFPESPQPRSPSASQAFDDDSTPASAPRRRSRYDQRGPSPSTHLQTNEPDNVPIRASQEPMEDNNGEAPPATPLRTRRRTQEFDTQSQDDRPRKRQRTILDLDEAFEAASDQAEADMFPMPEGEVRREDEARRPGGGSGPGAQEIATGILGELFMYKIMKDKLKLPGFDVHNWTSSRRGEIPGFEQFDGASVADFTYEDQAGEMTKYVFDDEQYAAWQGNWPTYHIEVKSTAGALKAPFIMRRSQIQQASAMSLRDPNAVPREVYVLARIWSVQSENARNIKFRMYPDPHRMLYDRALKVVSDVEVVLSDL